MAIRDNPYGTFNFIVRLGDVGGEDQIVGGFSDVSGLGNEIKFSEYRNGNDSENHVRKIPNVNIEGEHGLAAPEEDDGRGPATEPTPEPLLVG